MIITALLALATIAAIVATYTGIAYLFKCTAVENHLKSTRPDYREDKEGSAAWNRKRWDLEKLRTRPALICMAAYVVGMATMIPLKSMLDGSSSHLGLILTLVVSADLMLIGIRSMIHNERTFNLYLKREYPYSGL